MGVATSLRWLHDTFGFCTILENLRPTGLSMQAACRESIVVGNFDAFLTDLTLATGR